MKKFSNFIAGKWVAPESGEYFENKNPADRGDVSGSFHSPTGGMSIARSRAQSGASRNGGALRPRRVAMS